MSKIFTPEKSLLVPAAMATKQGPCSDIPAQTNIIDRLPTWDEDGVDWGDIPKPSGWRILVQPIQIKERTRGGLMLPDAVKDAQEYLRYVGKVVAIGPAAYKHRKFEGCDPWCKVGDWVIYGRYAGQEVTVAGKREDHKLRFVNDDEILAVTERPEKLVIFSGV